MAANTVNVRFPSPYDALVVSSHPCRWDQTCESCERVVAPLELPFDVVENQASLRAKCLGALDLALKVEGVRATSRPRILPLVAMSATPCVYSVEVKVVASFASTHPTFSRRSNAPKAIVTKLVIIPTVVPNVARRILWRVLSD